MWFCIVSRLQNHSLTNEKANAKSSVCSTKGNAAGEPGKEEALKPQYYFKDDFHSTFYCERSVNPKAMSAAFIELKLSKCNAERHFQVGAVSILLLLSKTHSPRLRCTFLFVLMDSRDGIGNIDVAITMRMWSHQRLNSAFSRPINTFYSTYLFPCKWTYMVIINISSVN